MKSKTEGTEKAIAQLIEKVQDPEKKSMLRSVYLNNERYVKTAEDAEKLRLIIAAMAVVDRKWFVTPESYYRCYEDAPLDIGHGQTISQPTTVARMLYLLDLEPGRNVLEIGTGSGWNAALLAWLVKPGKVFTVERIKELSELAQSNLKIINEKLKLGLDVKFFCGNVFDRSIEIWKKRYDRIIFTAGADSELQKQLERLGKALLKERGLLLYPTRNSWGEGELKLFRREKNKLTEIYSESGYSFVPLIGTKEEKIQ